MDAEAAAYYLSGMKQGGTVERRGVDHGWARSGAALVLAVVAAAGLSGCVSAAKTIVTAPVKAVGKGVDWATTSQDEADRNRGREIRRQEEREAKERRKREKEARKAAREQLE